MDMSHPVVRLLPNAVIIAVVATLAIRACTRVNRQVAGVLEDRRWSWNGWQAAVLLDGVLNGVPVRVRSDYTRRRELSVTLPVATHPPELEASLHRSGQIEFRCIGYEGRRRLLAQALEGDPPRLGPPNRAAIHAYFTPSRVQHLQALLRGLGWELFLLNREGLTVSRYGQKHLRWNRDQARYEVQRALTELQCMVPDRAVGIDS